MSSTRGATSNGEGAGSKSALRVDAAAEYLGGLSPGQVRGLIRAGLLEAVNASTKPNGRPLWVIRVEELDRFLGRTR